MRKVLGVALLFLLVAVAAAAQEDPVAQLQQRLAALSPEADYGLPGVDKRPPLALLQLKKALLVQAQDPAGARKYAEAGLADLLQAVFQPLPALVPGKLNELAYIADNDGSVQPYYLYLPPQYAPNRPWPLIVFLHGYVPDITVVSPWVLADSELKIAGELGAMVLIPYGRRNTDFQGVGEKDVLDALHEVVTRLGKSVDQDRVYLTGVSMGGRGTWHIAEHNPGLFAAIAPISGHTDMPRWWGWDRNTMPVWKRWLNARDNPLDLAENLRGTPIFVQHGEKDPLIPVEQARLMVQRLRELSIAVQYKEYPGQGHYIYWDPSAYQAAWKWLVQHKRGTAPARVTYKAYSLVMNRSDEAWWLELGAIQHWGEPAEVDATRTGPAEIHAEGQNWVSLAAQFPAGAGGRLVVNGTTYSGDFVPPRHAAGGDQEVRAELAPAPEDADLHGPVADAFLEPFVLVYGTSGTPEQTAELQAQAEDFAADWEDFADGRPRIMTDSDYPDGKTGLTPILFGTPQTNQVIAAHAAELPVTIGDHRYQIGDRVYAGPTLGLALRYEGMVIFAGEYWGSHLSANHKWDELPDYIVYDTSRQEYDGTDQHLCAGLFDSEWKMDPALQTRTE
jgi:acetyl esterase/lipase